MWSQPHLRFSHFLMFKSFVYTCAFNVASMWLEHRDKTVRHLDTEHSPSLSAFCVWWNHTRGSSHSCPASASAVWRPAAQSQMPRDDQSCSRCLLPESAPLGIKPAKHTRATFTFILSDVEMKGFFFLWNWGCLCQSLMRSTWTLSCSLTTKIIIFFPDLVKRIHRQQHNPWHIQSLDDLIGNCGFPWGAAATQPCTSTLFRKACLCVFQCVSSVVWHCKCVMVAGIKWQVLPVQENVQKSSSYRWRMPPSTVHHAHHTREAGQLCR